MRLKISIIIIFDPFLVGPFITEPIIPEDFHTPLFQEISEFLVSGNL
jgi:hypothetical protein